MLLSGVNIPSILIISDPANLNAQTQNKLAQLVPPIAELWNIPHHPDIFLVQKTGNSIGIEAVQKLRSWSQLHPYQAQVKLGLICEAETLTPEAQNALLKLLEEPTGQTCIALVARYTTSFLPTVVSRLIKHELANKSPIQTDKFDSIIQNLISSDVNNRLKTVDKLIQNFPDREDQKEILRLLIKEVTKKPSHFSAQKVAQMLESSLVAYKTLCLPSGNQRLTWETLMITMM